MVLLTCMGKLVHVTLKLPPEVLEAMQRKADEAGMSRHAWSCAVLAFASESALREQLEHVAEFDPNDVRDGKW